jgi:hypothetical protein
MGEMASESGLGGRIGGKVAALVVQSHLAAKAGSSGHTKNLAAMILDDFFQLTGSELRRTMGPLYDQLADDPDLHPDLRNTLKFIGAGNGQFATMLGSAVTGQAVGVGLGGLLTNLLQPVIGRSIAGNPHLPLSTSDAAQAIARNLSGGVDTHFDLLQQGIDDNRQAVMVELSRARLDPPAWQDLVNRGMVDEQFATVNLERLGYTVTDAARIMELRHVLHTPASLADLVTFGVLSEEQAAPMAARAGMSREDFHLLVLGNGQPPSTTDLLEGYRRGFIDKARLERGITQGPVRVEWFDLIERLRYAPMSTAEAIEAAVQGHISTAQSQAITQQNGLEPSHWQALYDTAGNPPGVQAMISMWHRGILTRAQLVAGIKESRLKNKYIEAVINAGETLPPERTIVSLIAKGDITLERGTDLLLKRGYAPDIAQALIASGHSTKTAVARELTAGQITTLYEDGALSRVDAITMLGHIQYGPDVAEQLLHLADVRAQRKLVDAALSRIQSAFLAGHIDENTAMTDMDALRIPTDQRDRLMTLWNLERIIPAHHLSEAQARAAAKKGVISWQDYADRLAAMRYPATDVAVLLALYGPATGS